MWFLLPFPFFCSCVSAFNTSKARTQKIGWFCTHPSSPKHQMDKNTAHKNPNRNRNRAAGGVGKNYKKLRLKVQTPLAAQAPCKQKVRVYKKRATNTQDCIQKQRWNPYHPSPTARDIRSRHNEGVKTTAWAHATMSKKR